MIKLLFRRGNWNGKVSSGRAPLWHIYANHRGQMQDSDPQDPTVQRLAHVTVFEALCGYQYKVDRFRAADGIGISELMWRDEVKTEKLRCKKCMREYERSWKGAMELIDGGWKPAEYDRDDYKGRDLLEEADDRREEIK